ncbi:MAG: aldo/keto reductase [Burkholderiaceae bacterium]
MDLIEKLRQSSGVRRARRSALKVIGLGSAAAVAPRTTLAIRPAPAPNWRTIPVSQEKLAPVGMGTWVTFNVGDSPAARNDRSRVLQAFFSAGGGLIDSSPMYGSAQAVLGDLLSRQNHPESLFSATKVWTGSADEGIAQVHDAQRLWRVPRFDLLQVHNLLNWQAHLPMLFDLKSQGLLRYVGVTTSHGRRHSDLAALMKSQPVDFVQLTYNPVDTQAARELLPLARERGIAVIVNRPFRRGQLIASLAQTRLPALAGELGCVSWAQLLLKWVLADPAVTCVIPATSQVAHMQENMAAGTGVLPDRAQRQQIAALVRQAW